MSSFLRLLMNQLAGDVRAVPSRAGSLIDPGRAVERCLTIEDVRRLALRKVPRQIFDFVDGGANDEVTSRRNQSDLAAITLRPRIFVDVARISTATSVQGEEVALPVLAAPMGLNGLCHRSGEPAVARAVHDAGSIYVLSMSASYSIEEVARAAPGPRWFQVFVWKDRGLVLELLDRARAAGYRTLVVTADSALPGRRERDIRNGLSIPPRITLRALAEGLRTPRWSLGFLLNPRMTPANTAGRRGGQLADYIVQSFDPSATWADLAWLRERWDGPLVVKGVMRSDDARRAVEFGANGIAVSNHGGRQLDHAASSVSALREVVDAVGGGAEVYFDGGIRRGTDILKVLALGARACLVGRPLAYGLAAGGYPGVGRVMTILAEELKLAMALVGCSSVEDIASLAMDRDPG